MPNWGGGGVEHPPEVFLPSCSVECSATFLKILGQGHLRSGHRVRSSALKNWSWPHLWKKIPIASRPQWWRESFETFRIWFTTKYLQLVYLGYFYIGDLMSGQLCDLPFISQWGINSNASNTYQICSNCSEPWSIRLLLMTSVQLCICDPWKGHLRSNNDIMRFCL